MMVPPVDRPGEHPEIRRKLPGRRPNSRSRGECGRAADEQSEIEADGAQPDRERPEPGSTRNDRTENTDTCEGVEDERDNVAEHEHDGPRGEHRMQANPRGGRGPMPALRHRMP